LVFTPLIRGKGRIHISKGMPKMIDQKTVNRDYPLPHADNKLREDVVRISDAFVDIDTDVNDLYTTTGTLSSEAIAAIQNTQNGTLWHADSTGNGSAYEVILNPIPTVLNSGLIVHMKAHSQNTGPATLNANSLGTKAIKKTDGSDLKSGDILSGSFCFLLYDGTNFQLINPKMDQTQMEVINSNLMRAFEEIQENHGGALLMEAGWSDSFGNSNEQGADEINSIDFQHDPTNTLYKGTDPGIGLNADHDYTTEDNYTTYSEAFVDVSVSSDTVTINDSSNYGANVLYATITIGANSSVIITRTNDKNVNVESGHSITGTNVTATITYHKFNSGVVQLANYAVSNATDIVGSGTASADSEVHAGWLASYAFNTNASNAWASAVASVDHWLKYDLGLGNATTVTSYKMTSQNVDSLCPGDFKLQGSNNDSEWTDLDTQTGITWGGAGGVEKEFIISNNTAYRYYRIYVTLRSGGSQGETHIRRVKLFGSTFSNLVNEYVPIIPKSNQSASGWTSENTASHTQIEALNSASVFYFEIFETNGYGAGTIFKITDGSTNIRSIVQYDGTNWQYNSNVTFGLTTWTNATADSMHQAVRDAMSVSVNQYTGTSRNSATVTLLDTGFSRGVGVVLYSTNQSNNPSVDQTRINFDSMRGAMDLRSKAYDPGFEPSEGYVWSRIEHSDSDGPGTFYTSRNGGTEWTAVSMAQQGLPLSGDIRIYRGIVDVNGQASGQDLRCRYQTSQGKDQFLHSWGLQAKS
jgi:hypothetical protein